MVEAVGKKLSRRCFGRRDMKCALCGAAALFVATAFLGCDRERCEDRGQEAIQAVLPHLNQDVVSNLVREASVCITGTCPRTLDNSS
jgi:hypothetical protein